MSFFLMLMAGGWAAAGVMIMCCFLNESSRSRRPSEGTEESGFYQWSVESQALLNGSLDETSN
jgi:hypothetical protein